MLPVDQKCRQVPSLHDLAFLIQVRYFYESLDDHRWYLASTTIRMKGAAGMLHLLNQCLLCTSYAPWLGTAGRWPSWSVSSDILEWWFYVVHSHTSGNQLQVLGNLYGLPSSGRNFRMAVWPALNTRAHRLIPSSFANKLREDPFYWCSTAMTSDGVDPQTLQSWSFAAARYKIKECNMEPLVRIKVTTTSIRGDQSKV